MSCCYLIIPYKLNGFKLGLDMDETSNSRGEADIDGNFLEQLSGSSKWSTDPITHSPQHNVLLPVVVADEHVVLNAFLCPGCSVGILSCIYTALLTGVEGVVVSQQWVILNQLPQAENL